VDDVALVGDEDDAGVDDCDCDYDDCGVANACVSVARSKNQSMQSKVVVGHHSQPHQVLRTYVVVHLLLPAEEVLSQDDVLA